MTLSSPPVRLRRRNLHDEMATAFRGSEPARFAIFDEVLTRKALVLLREELLSSARWGYRAQPGFVLCDRLEGSGIAGSIAAEILEEARLIEPALVVYEQWAFLHQKPFEEFVHTDVGSFVFTMWLTPERWDKSPGTSGLTLYNLSRPTEMSNSRAITSAYFQAHRPPVAAYVPYRENRAFLFPAPTFHSIGPCHFDASEPARMRLSMTIILDTPDHWMQQHGSER